MAVALKIRETMKGGIRNMLSPNLFRDIITESGLKQVEIARITGVKPSVVSGWVKGKSFPGDEKMETLAELTHGKYDAQYLRRAKLAIWLQQEKGVDPLDLAMVAHPERFGLI